MRAWVLALAAVFLVLGPVLLVAPVHQGRAVRTSVASGTWFDVSVPTSSSWTGQGVQVGLGWGTPGVVCPRSISCFEPAPRSTYLIVFDCGTSTCEASANYSVVGNTDTVNFAGTSGFDAIPGHQYQVWAWDSGNVSSNLTIPVRYWLNTPLLGGAFGAGVIVVGAALAVLEVRHHLRSRSVRAVAARF